MDKNNNAIFDRIVDRRSSIIDRQNGEKRITVAEASDRASSIVGGRSVVVDRRRSVGRSVGRRRSSAVGRSAHRPLLACLFVCLFVF